MALLSSNNAVVNGRALVWPIWDPDYRRISLWNTSVSALTQMLLGKKGPRYRLGGGMETSITVRKNNVRGY